MRAFITGASQGLGRTFSYFYASKGYDLVLVARNESLLTEIKKDIESKYHINVDVIVYDLTCDLKPLCSKLDNYEFDLAINNAGMGYFGEFVETGDEKLTKMIDLNVTSLVILNHYFLRCMKERRKGKILNVSSIAAFQPGPYMAEYYASKAFVLNLSESLDYEAKKYNVRVCALCPPPTKTNFFSNSGVNQDEFYKLSKFLDAQKVVEYTYKKLKKNHRIIIPGFSYRILIVLERIAPRSLVLSIMGKVQQRRYNAIKKVK